jgi:hypothetical protein
VVRLNYVATGVGKAPRILGVHELERSRPELLEQHALDLQPTFESLLEGGSIEVMLDENVVLSEIRTTESALWSLLVFSGYLGPRGSGRRPWTNAVYRLSIPNHEVRGVYATTFRGWMERRMAASGSSVTALTTALLAGDAERFEEQLQAFVTNVLSYNDPAAPSDPEAVYHAFVVWPARLAGAPPPRPVQPRVRQGPPRRDHPRSPAGPARPPSWS